MSQSIIWLYLLIALWILCSSLYQTFNSTRNIEETNSLTAIDPIDALVREVSSTTDHSLSLHRKQQVKRLKSLLDTYKKQHSVEAVLRDSGSICERKFAWTKMICSHAGNRLQEFLTEFAWAVIYNWTFLVEFNTETCYDAIYLQDWIVQVNNVQVVSVAKSRGCPIMDPRNESAKPFQMRAKNIPYHCCNFQNAPQQVVFFGGPSANIINLMQEVSTPHESMRYLRNRSDVLFSPWRDSLAAFGFLADYSFNFSMSVRSMVSISTGDDSKDSSHSMNPFRGKERATSKPFLIGLHLRHQRLGDEDQLDSNAESCLKLIRSYTHPDQKCYILLASDRASSLQRIPRFAQTLNCNVLYVPRNMEEAVHNWEGNLTLPFSEQGPWRNSIISMADYSFLSRSHLMIGTEQSTFSQLIASSVSSYSVARGKLSNNMMIVKRKGACTINAVRPHAARCRNDTGYSYDDNTKICDV